MNTSNAATPAFSRRRGVNIWVVGLAAAILLAWMGAASAQSSPSIVGLWHFKLVKQDGSLYYQSLQQYHADGLEMEDAATPPTHPAHICMGVWKQTGMSVSIYHIIWVYNGDGPPVGYVVLTEENTLSADGNALTGTFDMKQYDINDGSLVGQMAGTTVGRRIDFAHPFTLFGSGAAGTGPLSTELGYAGRVVPKC